MPFAIAAAPDEEIERIWMSRDDGTVRDYLMNKREREKRETAGLQFTAPSVADINKINLLLRGARTYWPVERHEGAETFLTPSLAEKVAGDTIPPPLGTPRIEGSVGAYAARRALVAPSDPKYCGYPWGYLRADVAPIAALAESLDAAAMTARIREQVEESYRREVAALAQHPEPHACEDHDDEDCTHEVEDLEDMGVILQRKIDAAIPLWLGVRQVILKAASSALGLVIFLYD